MSRKIWHKILGLFRGVPSGDWREFEGKGGEEDLQRFGGNSPEVSEAHPGAPIPSAQPNLPHNQMPHLPGVLVKEVFSDR